MNPPAVAASLLRAQASDQATARIDAGLGRLVVRVDIGDREDPALPAAAADTLAAALDLALEKRLPIVVSLTSSGVTPGDGIAAVHAWGQAARQLTRCSGVVPTIMTVDGPATSGVALLLGLVDFVVVVDDSWSFVSGPRMIEDYTGVPIGHEDLGGAHALATRSGVAALVVPDADSAADAVADLLSYLPDHNDTITPHTDDGTPADGVDLQAVLPESVTGGYDVRSIIASVLDEDSLLEIRDGWAPNLVTAFGHLDGMAIGIVANQPQVLAGTLDIAASQKGARFVAFCDAFNLPLLTLVDTPGFQPGKDLEWRGMIRHGAELAFAYARATVPRVSVTLRKSYGGAYIVMDSKEMGNDLAYAWPSAEIAVMGAKGAVEILHRRASDEERAEAEASYEQRLLNPWVAAERGSIDAVIDPRTTREHLRTAFQLLASKRERLPQRRHDNTPL